MLMTGFSALRMTCRRRILRSGRPLPRAVRTYGLPSSSSTAPIISRVPTASRPSTTAVIGRTRCCTESQNVPAFSVRIESSQSIRVIVSGPEPVTECWPPLGSQCQR